MSYVVENLLCGTPYRFFISSRNNIGDGPNSDLTYTVITKPGEPQKPSAPNLVKARLTSLHYKWDPPFDGGSAILGFKFRSDHLDNEIMLRRTQNSFEMRQLQPNTTYAVHVAAYNAHGTSEYSESTITTTLTMHPDRPLPLKPISGTWRTMELEGVLPYSFNSAITKISIERRWLKPFTKGPWESHSVLLVPADISVILNEQRTDEDEDSIASSLVSSLDGEMNKFLGFSSRARKTLVDELSHLEVPLSVLNLLSLVFYIEETWKPVPRRDFSPKARYYL